MAASDGTERGSVAECVLISMRQFGKEIYDHRKFEFEIATGEAAAGTLLAPKLPPPNVNHPDGRVALASALVPPYLIATHPWRTGGEF